MFVCIVEDFDCNSQRHISDGAEWWVESPLRQVLLRDFLGNLLCRQEEDFIWDVPDPTSDDTQSYPRKHIGIVSLTRSECPAIFQSHTLKRTSTGKDSSALGDPVALLSCALSLAGGVAQGKDDRALMEGSHVPQNLLREGSCDGSDTYNCCGLPESHS